MFVNRTLVFFLTDLSETGFHVFNQYILNDIYNSRVKLSLFGIKNNVYEVTKISNVRDHIFFSSLVGDSCISMQLITLFMGLDWLFIFAFNGTGYYQKYG